MRAATDLRLSPNHSVRAAGVAVEFLCVHWTGGSFAASMDWICRREYKGRRIYASYHAMIGPKGELAYPVAWDRASYSVGKSRPDDSRFTWTNAGNSASDNLALAGAPPVKPTAQQVELLVELLTARMRARGFSADETWRIRGHDQVAWHRGRKPDPQGSNWLPLDPIRVAVREQLAA